MTRKGHALLFYQGKQIRNGGNTMNIRKNIDYSEMYETLDKLMAKQLRQMELYREIGKAVCRRTEKGAAVMASEYLNKQYPDVKGFSPRSLRRMRDFYRTYENQPALLCRAMKLGWIQNVVIMEAELTMELREWYMKAAEQFGWSKSELISGITKSIHLEIILEIEQEMCDNIQKLEGDTVSSAWRTSVNSARLINIGQYLWNPMKKEKLWSISRFSISVARPVICMRC
jgi:hypothetical protein